mmetsp:Transcript_9903/g.24683  ORF Transcript_9903/g.24683 Transcript_9903/m.24683 type:complete len:305 (+) Transcript_9903:109-1023(+)
MRLTVSLMAGPSVKGLQKSARCWASSGESLISSNNVTSSMVLRSLLLRRFSVDNRPSRNSSMLCLVVGTNCLRILSLLQWTLHANTTGASASCSKTPGLGATVEMVIRRGASRKALPSAMIVAALTTAGMLSAGSPMPIKTQLSIGWRVTSCCSGKRRWILLAQYICAKISAVVRLLSLPIRPVEQKVHPCLQPTWDDTQSVDLPLSSHGIMTVSTSRPSDTSCSNSFVVPSGETEICESFAISSSTLPPLTVSKSSNVFLPKLVAEPLVLVAARRSSTFCRDHPGRRSLAVSSLAVSFVPALP